MRNIDWTTVIALIAILFILVPIGVLLCAWLSHRARERRKVTRFVPNLGSFESTDDRLWVGNVNDIQVFLTTPGGPPTQAQADQVQAVLADLPRLSDLGRTCLQDNEDCSWLEGGAAAFEPEGLSFHEPDFELTFGHPSDADGSYRVQFQGGIAEYCGRDD